MSFPRSDSKRQEASNVEGVIKRGYPSQVFDMVEAYLMVLDNSQRHTVEQEINQAFQEHNQHWRLLEGRFVKLDSKYLEEEVLSKASALLSAQGFEGPLDEFEHAIRCQSAGDHRDAITYAYNALESTVKTVLGIQEKRPKKLIRALLSSDLVPAYYQGFLTSLEDILQFVVVERSQPGRAHGQGESVVQVEPSYAELCLHLAGALIVFLIKRHREKSSLSADDLPL